MTTTTASLGHGLRSRQPQPRRARPRAGERPASALTWLERLAAWAERQPAHHHLGSCSRL